MRSNSRRLRLPVGLLVSFLALMLLTTTSGASPRAGSSGKGTAASSASGSLTSTAKRVFPNGITLVANLPPGGVTYTGAEALQAPLQQVLGVPVTVRPVVGGGGNTAAQYVYTASPASGTLMIAYLPQLPIGELVGHGTYKTLGYTPLGGMFGDDTSIYVAKAGSPLKDFASLRRARSTITIGVFGVQSSAGWMSAEFLSKLNHIKVATVPFKNAAASVDAVLSGAVDLASITRAQALPLIAGKHVQPVLEFAPKVLAYLPHTNSIGRVGSSKEAFYNLMGLVGPPRMPARDATVIERALAEIVRKPLFRAHARSLSLVLAFQGAATWKASIRNEYQLVKSHLKALTG